MSRILTIVILAGMLLWAGCDSFSTSPSPNASSDTEQAGHIQVYLTDAPGDIAEAFVTVKRVELVPSGTDSIVVLSDSTRRLDLLTLQNGVTETLADTTLPAGTYGQIRFIIGNDATIRLEDGSTPQLKVPSGPQTGIKIVVPDFTVETEEDTVQVTLDFNVEDSFVKAGRSGKYIFKPTVRAQAMAVGSEPVELFALKGAASEVNASGGTLAVDGIAFDVPGSAALEDADGNPLALADITAGAFVTVEGTRRDEQTFALREVTLQGDGQTVRKAEATLDAVDPEAQTVALLGATFAVTDETTFDGVGGVADLQPGDRVEVTYEMVEQARVAVAIEKDDAGPSS